MRKFVRSVIIAVCAIALMPQFATAQTVDPMAEEQQIRALDEQWVAAVAGQDAAATAAFYAEDGAILPPGSPIAAGREAIAAVWAGFFKLPGFKLAFAPTLVSVASAGDLAYDIGTYTLGFEGEQGPVQDQGKYVVVWKKVDGAWKVAADIFNSDGAAP